MEEKKAVEPVTILWIASSVLYCQTNLTKFNLLNNIMFRNPIWNRFGFGWTNWLSEC